MRAKGPLPTHPGRYYMFTEYGNAKGQLIDQVTSHTQHSEGYMA
jgi:hypothetical protein